MELIETTFSQSLRVDKDAGIIRGVKILGRESRNNRVYSDNALAQAARLYEGLKVHIDHPNRSTPDAERAFVEGFGELRDVKTNGDGVYGDLHFLTSHSQAATVCESAERFPKQFGLSHNATGEATKGNDGRWTVESVEQVRSVDIVGKPATNKGLFESEELIMPETKTKTVKEILESKANTKWLIRLREIEEAGIVDPGMEVAAEPDPAAEVTAALEKAAVAVLKKLFAGDLEESDAFAEIKKILGMKDQAAPDEGAVETPTPDAGMESIKAEIANLKKHNQLLEAEKSVRELLEGCGKTATKQQFQSLIEMGDMQRAMFIELLPEIQKTAPGVPKPRYSPSILESSKPAESREAFLEAITSR